MEKLGEILGAIIRPLIALIFGTIACVAFLDNKLNADQWLGLATVVIAFYFAAKTAENARRNQDVNIEGNVDNVRTGTTRSTGPKGQ